MDEYIPQLTLTPDLSAQAQPEVKKEEDLITKAQAAPEAGPDLSALSPAEQQAVLSFAKQIDLENAQQVLEYGASAQKNIADFSDTALAKVKTGDLGEIGTMLSGLLVELKTLEEPEKKGIAGLFRKAKINSEELKARFSTAEVNVDRISGELEQGVVTQETREAFLRIIGRMAREDGIEAVALGCTELPLLFSQTPPPLACLDTVEIHVRALVDRILEED